MIRSLKSVSIILTAILFCRVGFSLNYISSTENLSRGKIRVSSENQNVIDHWFFVVPSNNNQKGYRKKAKDLFVHTGEDFGVALKFLSKKAKAYMQIKLVVPNSPENFPCGTCKPGELTISPDRHTIIVNRDISSSQGESAFFWGIAASDPRGKYQMSLSFDGVLIETYDFEVK